MSTLFFKTPPQITLAEMRGSLPSTDAVFEAQSSTEFATLVASYDSTKLQRRGLKSLVELFLQDNWDGPSRPSLANLATENLIALIFGERIRIRTCVAFFADTS